MQEKYWYLKNCQLFDKLSDEQLQWLEARSRLRRFPRNTPVYLPADTADGVLLLVEGRVKICSMTSEGKQSILTFIEPGELFGELSLFEDGTREEFAEAAEPATIVLIPAEYMRQIVEQDAHLALGVTRLVGLRRRRIERRLKYLLFHSNRERLVHLLLELAEDYGQVDGHDVVLAIKLSHQDLASIIGSTRETVTVILGQLQVDGFLRLGRRKIILRAVERLAQSIRAPVPRIEAKQAPGISRSSQILGKAIF